MQSLKSVLFVLLVVPLGACGTFRSISALEPGSPRVFSGTRFDISAIRQDVFALKRFEAEPPPYPWLDLPASLVLDTLILPLTLTSAAVDSAMRAQDKGPVDDRTGTQ